MTKIKSERSYIKNIKDFNLSHNYPNPFNPKTVIKYEIPIPSKVTISIFNLLGQKIETLINEEKQPGTYQVEWKPKNLPSGIYIYQLKSGNFVQAKKMLYLK